MKFRWDKKYLYWGVTAFSVIGASVLLYFFVFHMGTLKTGLSKIFGILNPLIYGGIIAYLLNPLVGWFESLIYRLCLSRNWHVKKKVRSVIRFITVFVSLVLAALCIYGLLAMLIPEVIDSISNIVENFPRYVDNVQKWLTDTFQDNTWDTATLELFNRYSLKAETWLTNELMPQLNAVIKNLSSGVFDVLIFLKNVVIGALISIYILISKETFAARGKRIAYAVLSVPTANKMIHNLRFVDDKFGSFIIGKLIDSAIIGLLCYIGTSIIGTPYSLLVSVIVGVTNVIPFFGPYLGAVPCAFLILVVSPIQCLYFVIFIIVLQQLDGNFIGPKILGGSTGLSSFMVIVAILVGGGFFGVFGMFVGVPVCAVIVAICQSWMDRRITDRKLPETLEPYRDMESIDPESLRPIPRKPKKSGSQTLYQAMKDEENEAEAEMEKRDKDEDAL